MAAIRTRTPSSTELALGGVVRSVVQVPVVGLIGLLALLIIGA